MVFHKFPENIPPVGVNLLVRFSNKYEDYNGGICHYMLRYLQDYEYAGFEMKLKDSFFFEEAGGEQYFRVSCENVIGWISEDELRNVEVE